MVARYLGVVEAAGSNPVTQTRRRIAADKRALTLVGVRFLFVPRWDIVHYGRDTA